MKRFFSHLSSSNKPGNQLHQAALDLLTAKSNVLINDVNAFLDGLFKEIDELNARFSKCSPLHPSDSRSYDLEEGNSVNVWLGGYTVGFQLHPVKEAQ